MIIVTIIVLILIIISRFSVFLEWFSAACEAAKSSESLPTSGFFMSSFGIGIIVQGLGFRV